jgi:hypothetical protein
MIASSDNERLANAIHHVISTANQLEFDLFAANFLNIIVFAEVYYMLYYGQRLSNIKIVKAPHGPVPEGHKQAMDSLVESQKISITARCNRTIYTSLIAPDVSKFNKNQLQMLNIITFDFYHGYSGRNLSELGCNNFFWEKTELGEEIPLGAYFPYEICEVSQEELDALNAEDNSEFVKEWISLNP